VQFQRAGFKYYLQEKELDLNSAEKLLKFQPLEGIIQLPDTDLCCQKVKQLTWQVMQGNDGGWKASHFLANLKKKSP
jgi:hypothetical protein